MKAMYTFMAAVAIVALTAMAPARAATQPCFFVSGLAPPCSDAVALEIVDSNGNEVGTLGPVYMTEGASTDSPNPGVIDASGGVPITDPTTGAVIGTITLALNTGLQYFVADASRTTAQTTSDIFGTCGGTNSGPNGPCGSITNGVFLWSDPIGGGAPANFNFVEDPSCTGGQVLEPGYCFYLESLGSVTLPGNLGRGDVQVLAVSDLEAAPLPAALPLFATGLSGLGLLGWRRKRKNAAAIAAAKSKHLVGFRRDRREAVFLF